MVERGEAMCCMRTRGSATRKIWITFIPTSSSNTQSSTLQKIRHKYRNCRGREGGTEGRGQGLEVGGRTLIVCKFKT